MTNAVPTPRIHHMLTTPLATVRSVTDLRNSHPQFDAAALDRACDHIFSTWRKYVTEDQAREQAELFRRRCGTLVGAFILAELSDPDLDATLEAVAGAMGQR